MKINSIILFFALLCHSAFIHSSANSISTLKSRLTQLSSYGMRACFGCASVLSLKLSFDFLYLDQNPTHLVFSAAVFLYMTLMKYDSNEPKTLYCNTSFIGHSPKTQYTKEFLFVSTLK